MKSDILRSSIKKPRKNILVISSIVLTIVIMAMASLFVPSGPAGITVKADFGTPLYADTYINGVFIYCDNTNQYNWEKVNGNGDVAASFAKDSVLDTITIDVNVLKTRINQTDGFPFNHLNITCVITSPSSVATSVYFDYHNNLTDDGTTKGYAFSNYDVAYTFSEDGVYTIEIVFKIEEL